MLWKCFYKAEKGSLYRMKVTPVSVILPKYIHIKTVAVTELTLVGKDVPCFPCEYLQIS